MLPTTSILSACSFVLALSVSISSYADVIASDDFEDGNANGWVLNGNIVVNGNTAIGSYALRHKASGTSVLSVPTTGYSAVTVSMNLAATSLENGEDCYAEMSTNGGSNWSTVVEVYNGNDNGTFFSGSLRLLLFSSSVRNLSPCCSFNLSAFFSNR